MQATTKVIQPAKLAGEIVVPPSKSVMQRVCVATWIKGGKARITNPGNSADDKVILSLMRSAGCDFFTDEEGILHIDAVKAADHTLETAFFGESGLAARMCIPVLGLAGHEVSILADESLCRRPMQFFEEVLPQIGMTVSMENGHLPATISGRLTPRDITVDGSISSQFVTGLLMAYAGTDAKNVSITVSNPVSSPYIELTMDVMRAAGLKSPVQRGEHSFYFDHAETPEDSKRVIDHTIEGDWSAAAFWLVAGAIAGPLTVKGLDTFSAQADKAVLSALMDCGAGMSIESTQVTVAPAALKAFHFNATDCPDLFPPLAALACYAQGTSVIEGISRLRHKESDRAETICLELGKMGADISLQDDLMVIRGGTGLKGAITSAHNDHRIAMMCAIAALGADGPVTVEGAGAVAKSYPRFFEDLDRLAQGDTFSKGVTLSQSE